MDWLMFDFPVSGVRTYLFLPPLVSFLISLFTSAGGVSGAFLLLPFQMSVLGYTAPSVSGTNHVYNVLAIPSGVCRFIKERRMAWPLTLVIVLGTLPGVFLGVYARILYLPEPALFKFFVGCVLLYLGARLLVEFLGGSKKSPSARTLEEKLGQKKARGLAPCLPQEACVRTVSVSLGKVVYEFWGERFSFSTLKMFFLSLAVGLVGGAYGIGGGAIIAPYLVSVLHLPVYSIAGAALMGTFITSLAGVMFFTLWPALAGGASVMPDWPLGALFGIGGFAGVYAGARLQKYMPQKLIKLILCAAILSLAARYILGYLL